MSIITIEHNGQIFRADMSRAIDLSIAVDFSAPRVHAFDAPDPAAQPLAAGNFVGDVSHGGSCNCSTYSLTPHCNGTHTECAGHITREFMSVNSIAPTSLLRAALISIMPHRTATQFSPDDRIITRDSLQQKLGRPPCNAVIVRTLPNNKLNADYDTFCPAYFSADALAWLAEQGVEHLLVDLPSVDRMRDNGLLLAHRAFWEMPRGSTLLPEAKRARATITELIYVPDDVPDGEYLLNLQVAPLEADAAPSRPVLYPLLHKHG